MFLGYGGDKEFDTKSYVDASLTPIWIALSRDTGYVQWSNNLEQLQVERGSNIYDIKFLRNTQGFEYGKTR